MPGIYYINVASQILFYAVFALGLNVLVGYAGLVSLGHAGLFGIAAYAAGYHAAAGFGHPAAIVVALVVGAGVDGGVRRAGAARDRHRLHHDHAGARRNPLGPRLSLDQPHRRRQRHQRARHARRRSAIRLADADAFYYATLVVFLLAVAAMAVFVRSPFGAALTGTRDQPRRMNALGYHVWAIRFYACLFSGLLTSVAGILFVYYTQFISPQTLALTSSAEVLLMVISGGPGTLLGPIVGAALVVVVKNVVSGYIERWNFLLGAIFVAIVILMPEGLVPGTRAAVAAGAGANAASRRRDTVRRGGKAMSALPSAA